MAFLILVAAGAGTRLGRSEPKALVPLDGRPILSWALDAFASGRFGTTVVTAPPDRIAEFERVAGARARVVAGGQTRSQSVRRGFEAADPADEDLVAVHDAARPLVTPEEVAAVLDAAGRAGAAIAATPVVDTVKRVVDGFSVGTLDRSTLYGAATPQAFRAAVLRRALGAGLEATDEAALCEQLGLPVAVVPVSRLAFKITSPEDLEIAEAILRQRRERRREAE